MAFRWRRHYRLSEIHRRHWEETAKASGFPAAVLAAVIEDILERVRRVDDVLGRASAAIPDWLAEIVMRGIIRRARQLTE